MRKKTINIVTTDQGVVVKAKIDGRKVTVTPSSRSGLRGFCNDASAKRAWRKYAQRNAVTNYEYKLV